MIKRPYRKLLAAALAAAAVTTGGVAGAATPLRICATIPDLGSLAAAVGGDRVTVTVFAKGPEDPHFVEAKPGFVKELSRTDLFVQVGMELEIGWAPVLLQNARNARILSGARGFLDASQAVAAMEVPSGPLDRSMGDVHPRGNPHYLLDPLNGLRVAALIRDRLAELQPDRAAEFSERYGQLRSKIAVALVGEKLAAKYDAEKLALLHEHGKLGEFLAKQGDAALLGGWLGAMLPHFGAKAVADHNLWAYFSRRFGLVMTGFLEPKPGVPPTTRHLGEIIEEMKKAGVRLILASAYYDPRHADFVAANTGATVARMANQVGARPGADDYVAMIDYDVRQIVTALEAAK